jgi:hypothetical protein
MRRPSLRKVSLVAFLLVAGLYAGCVAFLYFQQRELLYFPTPTPVSGQQAPEIRFSSAGLALRGWVVNPGNPAAVLYFGGNAEAVERNAEFFAKLSPGRTVYLLPYRGYSGNPGEPTEAGLYADAIAEFDQLSHRHTRIAVIGRSLGTGVATYVAAQRPIERLLLVTPYDSIENVAQAKYALFPVSLLLHDKYESWRRAPKLRMPALILVAEQDRVVPRANTEHLIASFQRAPRVVTIAGAGHDDISLRREYSQALSSFFAE